ncbi:MAG: response regulator receiver modulated diguanylate cyclase [Frankiales bacterium]|nr:response regulator receiver modulated diguanylate cyclase [Frankiales bacterium]
MPPLESQPVVLIADDSTAMRSILRRQMLSAGLSVVEAANGEEAVRQARSLRPDLVLLDVDMPVLDGFQVMSVLRADAASRDVPVIFLTGRVQTAELVEGLDLGAFDYVKKPCDVDELVARVKAGLRVKARADELRRAAQDMDVLGSTDALTGLPNRRALERALDLLATDSRRSEQPLAVAVVDVDHFKRVNDVEGHGVGDSVLREVGRRLQSAVRPGQVLGRWGGEEFLALAPGVAGESAHRFGDRLRTMVGWEPVLVEGAPPLTVSVSVGVAAGTPSNERTLVELADAALYAAKEAGRDRVVLAPAEGSVSVPVQTRGVLRSVVG